MRLDKKTLRKLFPNLAKELESSENTATISSVRTDAQSGEEVASKGFDRYVPDVISFIRRCDTEEQAEAIISYGERKGEIGKRYAEELRVQLKEKGVRSFGPKKEENYYSRRGCQ